MDDGRADALNHLWHGTLAAVAAFAVLFVVSAQVQSLRAHSPWGEDPYDAVVSYTVLLLPIILLPTWLRVIRMRRAQVTALQRTRTLAARGLVLVFALVLAALAADWSGWLVNDRLHGAIQAGPFLLALLIGCTLLVTAAAVYARPGRQFVFAESWAAPSCADTLEDLQALAFASRSTGAQRAANWSNWVRQHRWPVVLAGSAAAGAALSAWHIVVEGPWANVEAALLYGLLGSLAPLAAYLFLNPLLHFVQACPDRQTPGGPPGLQTS